MNTPVSKLAYYTILITVIGALSGNTAGAKSFNDERQGFATQLAKQQRSEDPFPPPPQELFAIVRYPTALGNMSAYLSQPADPAKRHPAILWLTGGFPVGGIGNNAWEPTSPSNDQSAKVYRLAGLVMMYPALRGAAGNPGHQEGFLGEVDDVLSALAYLKKQPFVDPDRIYLGGHSTGGTLALLAAAASKEFRAVFAFGPVADPAEYGAGRQLHKPGPRENRLRAPIHFLDSIQSPTYVIEGSDGNLDSLEALRQKSRNKNLHFIPVQGADHFNVLAPVNQLIARRISSLDKKAVLEIDAPTAQKAFDTFTTALQEAADLQTLAELRRRDVEFSKAAAKFYLLSRSKPPLEQAGLALRQANYAPRPIESRKDAQAREYYVLVGTKQLNLYDLKAVFAASAAVRRLAGQHQVQYDGWTVHD